MAYKLINKETGEIERISDNRIFYNENTHELIEFDPIDKRKKVIQLINNIETIEDVKIILKKIVKEII